MSVPIDETNARVRRLASELADTARQSGQPYDTLSAFVGLLEDEHQLDVRQVLTSKERREMANRMVMEEGQATTGGNRRPITPAEAEAFVRSMYSPGNVVFPMSQVLDEMEEMVRKHERGE